MSNNFNVTIESHDQDQPWRLRGYVVYLSGFFTALPNVIAFISMWMTKGIAKKIKVPTMNLLLSDILSGSSLFVHYLLLQIFSTEVQGYICYLQLTWILTASFSSFLTVAALAIDRCICLYNEFVYITKVTVKRIFYVQICIWMLAFLTALTLFIDIDFHIKDCNYRDLVGPIGTRFHIGCGMVGRVVSAFAYTLILIKMKQMSSYEKQRFGTHRVIFRSTQKILLIGMIFHGMYLPDFCHNVAILMYPNSADSLRVLFSVASLLIVLNSFINPFIYVWRFPECRICLKIMLCFWNKPLVEQENEKRKNITVSYLRPNSRNT